MRRQWVPFGHKRNGGLVRRRREGLAIAGPRRGKSFGAAAWAEVEACAYAGLGTCTL